MDFRLQISSLALILVIIINYILNRKLNLMSTRLFSIYLFLVLFNITAEFFTLYTLSKMPYINMTYNRLAHQLFIGSLNLVVFFLYLYVDMKIRIQQRYTKRQIILRLIPLITSLIIVIFGKLDYEIHSSVRYSYGPMAFTVYLCIFIYMTALIRLLIFKNKKLPFYERLTILLGVITWIIIAGLQFFRPTLLLSSMGVSLMTLFVYISFENPREFLEFGFDGILNLRAFKTMTLELLARKNSFYIVTVSIKNMDLLENTLGSKELTRLLQTFGDCLRYKNRIYHSSINSVSTIILNKKNLDIVLNNLNNTLPTEVNGISISPYLLCSVLECPLYANSFKDITDILEFIVEKYNYENTNNIFIIDNKVIEHRNYISTVASIVQDAINNNGLEVYYQPIYSTKEEKFVSAEALVRLKDETTLNFISPEVFIPIAEEKGMISKLGNIVFEKVCKFYSEKKLWELGVHYIEVNLSGVQSIDNRLPDQLLECMKKYNIKPEYINLEITETAATKAEEELYKNMEILREAGCKFSMDDFGTGYSNLSKISEINFELIKLDKSLIWPCFNKNNDKAIIILDTCINMLKQLKIAIVAEGVETPEQFNMLTEKGIDYLQGYYFSRPICEDSYYDFLKSKI